MRDAQRSCNKNRPLYRAIQKYGAEHFKVELIEETYIPEEREIFWIVEKGSYHNGYNATLGGDGKKYIDYDEVIAVYSDLCNESETARMLDISVNSVRAILKQNGIEIVIPKKENSKAVEMYDLNDGFIMSFESMYEAAAYLINEGLTGCKVSTIRTHISEVCRGKRKTAAGFKWKVPE